MTQLDKALIAARQDRTKANDFYTLFLNTDIYIPTHDPPEKSTDRRLEDGEKFWPVELEREGKTYGPIFDTLERLQAWAKRPIGYVRLPAHVLLRSMDLRLHLVLNLGTEYFKEFGSEEVKELKEMIAREQKVPAGTQILVGTPAKIPDGLEEAVRACLSRNKEVKAGYLGQVMIVREGEKPHLVLVLEVEPVAQNAFSAIVQEVGVVIKGLLKEGEYLDMLRYEEQGLASRIVRQVKPFYVRAK